MTPAVPFTVLSVGLSWFEGPTTWYTWLLLFCPTVTDEAGWSILILLSMWIWCIQLQLYIYITSLEGVSPTRRQGGSVTIWVRSPSGFLLPFVLRLSSFISAARFAVLLALALCLRTPSFLPRFPIKRFIVNLVSAHLPQRGHLRSNCLSSNKTERYPKSLNW